jgi:hypothetical protein
MVHATRRIDLGLVLAGHVGPFFASQNVEVVICGVTPSMALGANCRSFKANMSAPHSIHLSPMISKKKMRLTENDEILGNAWHCQQQPSNPSCADSTH